MENAVQTYKRRRHRVATSVQIEEEILKLRNKVLTLDDVRL